MNPYIRIHPEDNVAVALQPLSKGTLISCSGSDLTLSEDIPQGHKFSLTPISKDAEIIKYGSPIGHATTEIPAGTWVHIHNIKTNLSDLLTYTYQKTDCSIPTTEERFFQGYRRKDGKAGVRNEIWIIPTVGCVNNIATAIERQAQQYKTEQIDAIAAFPHPYGCSQMGDDQEHSRTILADLIRHPNAGGVLVLGLGCENSNIDELKKYIGDYDEDRVKFLVAQESEDEIADALSLIRELIAYASTFHREPIHCKGLNLLSAPGNDLVASTALAASGAHIVLFTTGRGTPFASPVPTVKISSNTRLYEQKKNWIDFNCGVLVEGTDLQTLRDQFFEYVLEVASGKQVEGNFLRAFVDYFIDVMNEKAGFHSKVVLCQPIAPGLADMINDQEGLYTLFLRGFENGQTVNNKRVISCVSRCLNPYQDYESVLACAENPDLRFIACNTTEAGIAYDPACQFTDVPANSYPGKLTQFLYRRFQHFGNVEGKGFVILSCELIDNNGKELEKCVLKYAEQWQLGDAFIRWIQTENIFCSTLVDRIVTGYPRAEAETICQELGYQDNLLDTGEVFAKKSSYFKRCSYFYGTWRPSCRTKHCTGLHER